MFCPRRRRGIVIWIDFKNGPVKWLVRTAGIGTQPRSIKEKEKAEDGETEERRIYRTDHYAKQAARDLICMFEF